MVKVAADAVDGGWNDFTSVALQAAVSAEAANQGLAMVHGE